MQHAYVVLSAEQGGASGILLFKDEKHQYFLAVGRDDQGECISLRQIGDGESKVLASVRLDDGGVLTDLKVVSRGTHYDSTMLARKVCGTCCAGMWTLGICQRPLPEALLEQR